MATLTGEQIRDGFIQFLHDNYGYWTDLENSHEAVPYINGAFDLMTRYMERLDKVGDIDECGEK